jgi:hypothetical protein
MFRVDAEPASRALNRSATIGASIAWAWCKCATKAASMEALLREAIDTMLAGDIDVGTPILRDYIKATAGFEKLGAATGTSAKS